MTKEIYCIYTNKIIDESLTTPEHIIPLSLGGCNDFTIPVEAIKNSELGSAIDGKMANDFIINLIRQTKDYRGHKNKKAELNLKKSKIIHKTTNKEIPAQIKFTPNGLSIYNPIEKKILSKKEIQELSDIHAQFEFDRFLKTCFVAKVVLAAGYFAYGDTFVNHADHESIRKLMNLNITETKETLKNLPLRICDIYHPETKDFAMTEVMKQICIGIGDSCVMFLLSKGNIIGGVGIGGKFIGAINFKADHKKFPNEAEFDLGHVLAIQEKQLRKNSFRNMVKKLHDIFVKTEEEE